MRLIFVSALTRFFLAVLLWLPFSLELQADVSPMHLPAPTLMTNKTPAPVGFDGTNVAVLRPVRIPTTNANAQMPSILSSIITNHSPEAILTNQPDFIEQGLKASIDSFERELTNQNLSPALRATFERLVEERKAQLADHEANALLWSKLHMAEASKDSAAISQAKQELADYLAARLGKIKGKKYAAGTSYEAITEEYQKASAGRWQSDGHLLIRIGVFAVFILPPILIGVLGYKKFYRRSS